MTCVQNVKLLQDHRCHQVYGEGPGEGNRGAAGHEEHLPWAPPLQCGDDPGGGTAPSADPHGEDRQLEPSGRQLASGEIRIVSSAKYWYEMGFGDGGGEIGVSDGGRDGFVGDCDDSGGGGGSGDGVGGDDHRMVVVPPPVIVMLVVVVVTVASGDAEDGGFEDGNRDGISETTTI